jgi:hypothetical protein
VRTPQDDGQILIDPPENRLAELIERNRDQLNASVNVFGRPLAEFRRQAIAEISSAARAYLFASGESLPDLAADSLIVAGHQPDLFHPGVWLKNFVLHSLGRRVGAAPLNLIVDNDTVKHTSIALPTTSPEPEYVERVTIPYDSFGAAAPFEERPIRDACIFDEFPSAVQRVTATWPDRPIAGLFWDRAKHVRSTTSLIGEIFAASRRSFERQWGCRNLEVPISHVARTAVFAEWAASLLENLPTVHVAYNTAVADYRRRQRLRGRQHPVPDLAGDGEWLEAPFWSWRTGAARREPLFIRAQAGRLQLRSGRTAWPDLPRVHEAERWLHLEHDGFKIRPRALTTTLFARLVIGDLFIHGVGGAKYDEVTDQIVSRLFGIDPPAYAVVSGTLRLNLQPYSATDDSLRAVRRRLRDLDWNPQRFLAESPSRERHAELTRSPAVSPFERRARFEALRELNSQLRPLVAAERVQTTACANRAAAEVAANSVLSSREYSFVLHSETRLREFLTQSIKD